MSPPGAAGQGPGAPAAADPEPGPPGAAPADAGATPPPSAVEGRDEVPAPRLRLAVSLLAAAGLMLEIALTRLLSLFYLSPFVYVLLAVAVLGIGLGAAAATLLPSTRTRLGAVATAVAGALATPLVAALLLAIATTPGRLGALALCALPFAFLGHATATLFALRSRAAPRLYLSDLAGAGAGALASVPALDLLGALGTALVVALLASAAAVALAPRRARAGAALLAAVCLALLAAQRATGLPKPPLEAMATAKPLRQELRSGAVDVAHAWDALGRSDLVRGPDGSVYLYLDGGAGSLVPDTSRPSTYFHDAGAYAFAATDPKSVYVIGPGGGLDVALARLFGVPSITAVELNGAGVRLAERASTMGLVGGRPAYDGVDLHVDEGRSYLERQPRKYDLILLSQVVTDAAELQSYALVENSLYTVEAFRSYLAHLEPGGAVAFKLYDEATLTRALTTAIAALGTYGVSQADALHHLVAVLDDRGPRPIPLLLAFDHALTRAEALGYGRLALAAGLRPLYLPYLVEDPPLDALSAGRIGLAQLEASSGGVDIAPVHDSRPFFFKFEPGLPATLVPLLWTLAILVVVAAAWLTARQRRLTGPARAAPLLFACLGAGFMLFEVGALQRLRLYLGHPTLTLAVGLAALLVGAGLGAGGAAAFARRPAAALRAASIASLTVALGTILWSSTFTAWTGATLPWPTAARAALAAAVLLVAGLPMGMPFPLALRAVGEAGEAEVALGWAVNGLAAVAGSSGATAIALLWGFPLVHAAAAGAYLLAAAAAGAAAAAARRAAAV